MTMGNNMLHFPLALFIIVIFDGATGFSIRNELLGKCLQVQDGSPRGGRVFLEDCSPDSPLQEWQWLPGIQALSSVHTGDCLTAQRLQQHDSVRLQGCRSGVEPGAEEGGDGGDDQEQDKDAQSWACSRKGHLTLQGKGLYLSVRQDSGKIWLSKERGQVSKWRLMGNDAGCREKGVPDHNTTAPWIERPPQNTGVPEEPSVVYFSMDYGMGWKVTMLVLSSLALVLGAVILIVNVHHNRRKKVVCVLKSYSPAGGFSPPGSPVPGERAPLTKNAQRPPRSPALQHGEILIEWKDGTVTPLFDSCLVD